MKKRILSFLLTILILSMFIPGASAASAPDVSSNRYLYCADSLYSLGLMKGTGMNNDGSPSFELYRSPTREEAVVMLVRMLGKEKAALSGAYGMPFSDVDDWAQPYIAYAYSAGLTNGESASSFGSAETVTASQYITFVLRALGYSSGKDFQWDSAWTLSDSIGLTDGTYKTGSAFLRGDVAVISYNALSQKTTGEITLLASLYQSGAVSSASIYNVGLSTILTPVLSASEIYQKCASAVFYITIYDSTGHSLGQASGFFIDSNGTAVTNYHVVEDAYSAKVKTMDGSVYNVLGVCSSDANNDLAIIKVDGSGFPYLQLGDSSNVGVGSMVYTIGNPQGLESSISQGIVSYYYREIQNTPYIQITAPISPGSSGGALLDASGKVIGVTTGGITTGQSLNLAVPINNIKGLQHTSYTSLVKNIPTAGKEIGYAAASAVPDYGAYFGKNVYYSRANSIGNISYWYKKSSATPNVIDDYYKLLEKWGFQYKTDYNANSAIGKYYTKDNIVVLTVDYTQESSNAEFIVVQVLMMTSSNYPKTETGSNGFTDVPNFENYFGLADFTHTLTSTGFINKYEVSQVNVVDPDAINVYSALLEKWGFSFQKGTRTENSMIYYYVKNNTTVSISEDVNDITLTVSKTN